MTKDRGAAWPAGQPYQIQLIFTMSQAHIYPQQHVRKAFLLSVHRRGQTG